MTADRSIGLTVDIHQLIEALHASGFDPGEVAVADALAALVELRLARGSVVAGARNRFGFVHRRFQEYFAACGFAGDAISPAELMTNEGWRDIVVMTYQSGAVARISPLLAHAADLLETGAAALRDAGWAEAMDTQRRLPALEKARRSHVPREFPWPANSAHVMGILSALAATWDALDPALSADAQRARRAADDILLACVIGGVRPDHAAAIELSGAGTAECRDLLLSWACQVRSGWLEDVAIAQASVHDTPPAQVEDAVRRMLVRRAVTGELRGERIRTEAQLRRMDRTGNLVRTVRWLSGIGAVDGVCWGALCALFVVESAMARRTWGYQVTGVAFAFVAWSATSFMFRSATQNLGLATRYLTERATLNWAAASVGFVRAWCVWFLIGLMGLGDPALSIALTGGTVMAVFRPGTYAAAAHSRFGSAIWWHNAVGFAVFVLRAGVVLGGFVVFVVGPVALLGQLGNSIPWLGSLLLATMLVIPALVLLARLARWLLDLRTGLLLRRATVDITAERLLMESARFRTMKARVRFLRWVRQHRRFRPGPICDRILREAMLAIERDKRIPRFTVHLRRPRPWVPDGAWSERFATLYRAQFSGRRGGMAAWFGDTLDELGRLREQTELRDQPVPS